MNMFTRIGIFVSLLVSLAISAQCGIPTELQGYKVLKLWDFNTSSEGWAADHNIGKFAVKGGILSVTNDGADPWIINRQLNLDVSKYSFIAIKMRSSAPGDNQIYFTTKQSPVMGEKQVTSHSVIGDGEYHVYTVNMSELKAWTGILNVLRIDTVNGGQEVSAKADIDWIAIYQTPAKIMIGRLYAGLSDGKISVSIPIKNTGGEASVSGMTISADSIVKKLPSIGPRQSMNLLFSLPLSDKEIAIQGKYKSKLLFTANLISPVISKSLQTLTGNDNLAITYIPGTIRMLSVSSKDALGKRKYAGVFRPMAALAYIDTNGIMKYAEIEANIEKSSSKSQLLLTAKKHINDGDAVFNWKFNFPASSKDGFYTCTMKSNVPINVLRFEGPRFLVGEGAFGRKKDIGIFPGIEYLGKDEPSNADWFTGPKFGNRRVPHPYKVTIPVMVIENSGMTAGISWKPLASWTKGKRMVSAEFESPNRSIGADNHLLTLFAPGIPDYVDEDTDFAKTPYTLKPGKTMEISASFFADSGNAVDAVASRLVSSKLPIANGIPGVIGNCFKAYTESLYSPEANGWKFHFGLHQQFAFNPNNAALILAESIREGTSELAEKCKILPSAQLSQYTGTSMDWFNEGRRTQISSIIARQASDGGFPYQESDEVKKKIKDYAPKGFESAGLGKAGATNSGLIAKEINGILSYALQTGDMKAIDAGIMGLHKMNEFTVPRGAQGWEVHVHAPDVYAAGLSVDANIMGYQLTGNEEYLQKARFWAYSGIPFVYDWVPPIDPTPASIWHFDKQGEGSGLVTAKPSEFFNNVKRYINPGATIAVFGSTFYIGGWYGNPVQWCGLSWSNAVRRYLRLRPDPTLKAVVDNVFASASQQQNEKGFLAGTYTDSWNLLTNTTSPVCITPDLIIEHAYYLIDEKRPFEIQSVGFNANNRRSFLSTFAIIEGSDASDGSVNATLKFYPNQDVYSCISNTGDPKSVLVDGRALSSVDDLHNSANGYYFDSRNKALHIKYRSSQRTANLDVK